MVRAVTTVAAVVAVLCVGLPAAWPDGAKKTLETGRAQFFELEYQAAVGTLRSFERKEDAPKVVRLEGLEILAICHLAIGRDEDAARVFRLLRSLDSQYELQYDDGSPKVQEAYAKASVGNSTDSQDGLRITNVEPDDGDLVLSMAVDDDEVRSVVVVVVEGDDFEEVSAREVGGARWRARLTGASDGASYYVEARNVVDGVVASLGGPDELLVYGRGRGSGRGGRESAAPWYKKWYVWAGVAAGAAVVGGVALWATSGGPSDGTLDPGRVVLSP